MRKVTFILVVSSPFSYTGFGIQEDAAGNQEIMRIGGLMVRFLALSVCIQKCCGAKY